MTKPLWTPDTDRRSASQVEAFRMSVGVAGGYDDLHRWSIDRPGEFWAAVWEHLGVVGDPGGRTVGGDATNLSGARFFPDGRLNVAENLLSRTDDAPALLARGEDSIRRDVSWQELHDLVSRLQQALLELGVEPGDRVVAWLPNMPEVYAVMLAAASIGAVFSSTSPDFGTDGVLDRFGQIRPVVLFATDGYHYAGRHHDTTDRLIQVADGLTDLRRVVVVPGTGPSLSLIHI